jgi:excisionase family DNA binding protein
MLNREAKRNTAVEQWVSVEQIAHHLNVKALTIYKWLERKDMPAHKVGRLWRFKISEVDSWVTSGGASELPKKARRN